MKLIADLGLELQSLFTWIFYLFIFAGISTVLMMSCFNPYSPGFSIYLLRQLTTFIKVKRASILIHLDFLSIFKLKSDILSIINRLQSLFTWIFYLFELIHLGNRTLGVASILIHLDFLSIC